MNPVDQVMEEGRERGVYPSATLLFAKGEEVLHRAAYGEVQLETLFDVASLTKVLATTPMAMRLQEEGVLDLNEEIAEILPYFVDSPYAGVSVAQLLAHTSGMPAYRPFFEQFDPGTLDQEDLHERRDKYLKWIAEVPPEAKPGSQQIYSDLDFIVLGVVLEAKSGKDLRTLFCDQVSHPLGMQHTLYSPVDNLRESIAPTEKNPWRGRLLCGEVHDENAYVLGGAAGHAGVFTSVLDCHMFAREFIKAARGGSGWLRRETVERFINPELTFPLGWDRPSRPVSQAGGYFSETAIGHLGFTGCSLWIDLEQEIIAILFTNRVHPHRDNELIKEFRPRLHDALFRHYLDE